MRKIFSTILLSLSALSVSCGDSNSTDNVAGLSEGSLDGAAYSLTSGAELQKTETELSGSGTILFKNPLGEIGSKDAFLLQFKLEDGGKLELLTHTDNAGKSGVSAVVTRESGVVSIAFAAAAATSDKKVLEGIDATGEISLLIDVHNDESPAHILVWNGTSGSFSEGNALINSEDDITSPGKGSGVYWGLSLTKATVLSASIQAPKFVEE